MDRFVKVRLKNDDVIVCVRGAKKLVCLKLKNVVPCFLSAPVV